MKRNMQECVPLYGLEDTLRYCVLLEGFFQVNRPDPSWLKTTLSVYEKKRVRLLETELKRTQLECERATTLRLQAEEQLASKTKWI